MKSFKELMQELEFLYRQEQQKRKELDKVLHEINMTKIQLITNLNIYKQ